MAGAQYLQRVMTRPGAAAGGEAFPFDLPFLPALDISFTTPVTFFVGENGSGKSTVIEAIAEASRLPVGGGGRNEIGDLHGPQRRSDLAPAVHVGFKRHPPDAYFFRAEFQAHFASLLDERKADPGFLGNPYARYGGRSLHTRSHGEAFLEMFLSWMSPGLILMDEPESAPSPQRQLTLLVRMADLVAKGNVQLVIATHSPILMTFPHATILSFEGSAITRVRLEETSHFQITKGMLESPERYWHHMLAGETVTQ